MTEAEKLQQIKTLLGITDTSEDDLLNTCLTFTKNEILSWLYSLLGGVPVNVSNVPMEYIPTQIMAVIAGFNITGAENQLYHSENGINRTFKYSDMVHYVRNTVIPFAKVV